MRKRWVFVVAPLIALALAVGLYFALRPAGPGGEEGGQVGGPTGLPTVVAAVGNTCVACHRQIPEGTLTGHSFRDWERSLHAAQDVACEACHGGDPTKGEKDRAHEGVIPSTELGSKVYFKNIPATCGRCHTGEFERFQTSVHYRQLEEEGRGPNCVTCHGAMAISILTPEELQQTCSACHNERLGIKPVEPIKARYVLIMFSQVKAYLEAVKELVELKKAAGQEVAAAEALIAQAEQELQEVRREWHTFIVDRIEEGVQKAFATVQAAVKQLQNVEE
ncbi:MAG: hypothetical protein ACE5KR_03845 [Candidatus Bipolaricaulia bacterium]